MTDDHEQICHVIFILLSRAVEEVSQSDLHDIDIIKIAEMMTVDHFYDLGVALGFRFQQLDVIEYRRFRDRQQAIYDMLVTWRQRQASGPEAKETFVSLLKSFDLQAHEMAISGLTFIIYQLANLTLYLKNDEQWNHSIFRVQRLC